MLDIDMRKILHLYYLYSKIELIVINIIGADLIKSIDDYIIQELL